MDQCYFSWRSRHFFTKKLGERKFCVNSTNFAHCLLVKIMTQKKSTGMHPGPKLCEKKKTILAFHRVCFRGSCCSAGLLFGQ